MSKIAFYILATIVLFGCKKGTQEESKNFDKSLLIGHWWTTDYARTNPGAEYKGKFYNTDSSYLIAGFYNDTSKATKWWWIANDTIICTGKKAAIKNLTKDSLAVYWITVNGNVTTGFTAYYYAK